jgi:uncharacterized protein
LKFWDSSAIVPLLVEQPLSAATAALFEQDPEIALWWASPVEVASATARLVREGLLSLAGQRALHDGLSVLCDSAVEIEPHDGLRERALRLLSTHPLRAADSLQLAAALVWCQERPRGEGFVSLDDRLREAAQREGFSVFPASE